MKSLGEPGYVHVSDGITLFNILVILNQDEILKEIHWFVLESYVWFHAVKKIDINIIVGCNSDGNRVTNVPPRRIVICVVNNVVVRIIGWIWQLNNSIGYRVDRRVI
mgnify:CR=1 FL=1